MSDNILSDAQIVELRDACLPSQGERFDCIAFGRMLEAAITERTGWQPMTSAPEGEGKPLLIMTLSGIPLLVTYERDGRWTDWHTGREMTFAHFRGWCPMPAKQPVAGKSGS